MITLLLGIIAFTCSIATMLMILFTGGIQKPSKDDEEDWMEDAI